MEKSCGFKTDADVMMDMRCSAAESTLLHYSVAAIIEGTMAAVGAELVVGMALFWLALRLFDSRGK
eukprot:SAG31_NODE_2985_length_4812_cov_3.398517_6_plen_66_part_00